MFSPEERTIISFFLPIMYNIPFSLNLTKSPVLKYPSSNEFLFSSSSSTYPSNTLIPLIHNSSSTILYSISGYTKPTEVASSNGIGLPLTRFALSVKP